MLLKHTEEIHAIEDLPFLEDISDVFDIRNWDLTVFDPDHDKNDEDDFAKKEIEKLIAKVKTAANFTKIWTR